METSLNWVLLNIVLPLLPLILRGIIKIFFSHFDISFISAAELWFVLAIIALIVSQDLKLRIPPLDNNDKKIERHNRASIFITFALIFVFFCGVSEILHILSQDKEKLLYQRSYNWISIICYLTTIGLIRFSITTQKEFNLKSKFF